MKRKLIGLVAALALVSLPLAALAAEQGSMEGMKGMSMKNMVMIGTETQNGVKAMGHLMTMPASATENGMNMTHHFMVMFNDAKSGAPITDGLVALKITAPSGATTGPVRLMSMTMGSVKGFGAGVNLSQKGTYQFEVGCKLPDGHKRQFNFTYTLK